MNYSPLKIVTTSSKAPVQPMTHGRSGTVHSVPLEATMIAKALSTASALRSRRVRLAHSAATLPRRTRQQPGRQLFRQPHPPDHAENFSPRPRPSIDYTVPTGAEQQHSPGKASPVERTKHKFTLRETNQVLVVGRHKSLVSV